jgi:organic hydroperoxide reductase OsmC/OhrA
VITVSGDASEDRIRKLVDTAHEHCFIANSLRTDISVEPSVRRR